MKYPTLKIVFDRKKVASKTRKGLVQIEVMSERRRKWIGTGVKVYAGQWGKSNMVIGRMDADILNDSIRAQLESIMNWVNDLRRNKEAFEFDKLDRFLTTATVSSDFLEFLNKRIEERPDIRESTRKTHRVLLQSLKDFGRIKYFSDLTRVNILAYDEWLHSQGYAQQTIHAHHKMFKTYINDAIRQEVLAMNPYQSVKIERGKSKSRQYLSEQELHNLIETSMKSEALTRVRDVFLFQCFTGLAYADLLRFDFTKTVENNGRIVLHDLRQKSGEDYYLVLLSPAVDVLKKYDFKLPLLSNQKYNNSLKIVGKLAGLDRNLTSHMGRHTFAVYCLNNGVPIETLAKMMGHTDIKTTQLYAKIANTTVEAAFDKLEMHIQNRRK